MEEEILEEEIQVQEEKFVVNKNVDSNKIIYIDTTATTETQIEQAQQYYDEYIKGNNPLVILKNVINEYKSTIGYLDSVDLEDGSGTLTLSGHTLSENNYEEKYGVYYKYVFKTDFQIVVNNDIVTNCLLDENDVGYLLDHYDYVLGVANEEEFEPESDYNPATKKYVDDIVGDINEVLSTLTTPGGGVR